MTHAMNPREERSTSDSWLAPFIAFIAWLLDTIAKLQKVRRTTRFKPTWRERFPELIRAEWHRDQLLAQGAALILAGKSLDTPAEPILDPPPGYGGPCPRTPFEMNRRYLALARFLKDPETFIRRHAAQIAKDASRGSALAPIPQPPIALILSSARSARSVYPELVEGSHSCTYCSSIQQVYSKR